MRFRRAGLDTGPGFDGFVGASSAGNSKTRAVGCQSIQRLRFVRLGAVMLIPTPADVLTAPNRLCQLGEDDTLKRITGTANCIEQRFPCNFLWKIVLLRILDH
jgi:hypothetical protein